MQGKDEVSIAITFIIGFVGGFYFFLTGYAPYVEEVKETVFTGDLESTESLIIIAEQYGGCSMMQRCASFQLRYDGSYSYLPYSVAQGAVPVEGVLPRTILNDVRANTLPAMLEDASSAAEADNCISFVDGIDYSYEIVRNGKIFRLDTCGTTVKEYPDLVDALDDVWNYVGNN